MIQSIFIMFHQVSVLFLKELELLLRKKILYTVLFLVF